MNAWGNKMAKQRVRETPLFKAITAGKDKAFKDRMAKELTIVRDDDPENINWITLGLNSAFVWEFTPQGYQFWSNLFYTNKFPA